MTKDLGSKDRGLGIITWIGDYRERFVTWIGDYRERFVMWVGDYRERFVSQ